MSSKWDSFFVDMSFFISTKSKDPSTKVGAVIVGPDNELVSMGYNGFPRGVKDDISERYERPAKYKYTEHAERNSIYNAARIGAQTKGCSLYLNFSPRCVCSDCTRALIQSGIHAIIGPQDNQVGSHWEGDFSIAHQMMVEYGIELRYV